MLIQCFSNIFPSLNPHLGQQAMEQDCSALSVFSLGTITECNWAESVIPCLRLSPLSFGLGGGGVLPFELHSITCVQYTLNEDSSCSCQMDCLLSFDSGFSTGEGGYAFFGSISCDASQLDGVKDYFKMPDINITFVSGSSPIASCNMTGQFVI